MTKKKYVRRISDDTSRCHDRTCSLRKSCLRFLNRQNGGEHTVHTKSLAARNGTCDYYVENK